MTPPPLIVQASDRSMDLIGEVTDLFHDAINEHGAQGYGRDNPARFNFTEVVGKLQRDVTAAIEAALSRTHLPTTEGAGSASGGVREAAEALLEKLTLVEEATSGIWSEMYAREAEALQAALRQAAPSSAGMVLVPREPTEAMLKAGSEDLGLRYKADCFSFETMTQAVWRAMLDAAAPQVEGEGA
jgi:hypothetical protein